LILVAISAEKPTIWNKYIDSTAFVWVDILGFGAARNVEVSATIYVRRKQQMKKTILTIVLAVLTFGSLSAQAAQIRLLLVRLG